MSILIIGGDQISQISSMLTQMGAKTINHWDARKKSSAPKKKVPQDTDCIVMLTSFLNHNTMLKYKNEAKKRNIPFICAKCIRRNNSDSQPIYIRTLCRS
jgi:hypothetical protein